MAGTPQRWTQQLFAAVAASGPLRSNPPVTRILPFLKLLRLGTLFSPAADVVASAAVLGLPWDTDLVRAMLASVALYAAGMVWNDIADRRLDAVQRPERPLPRGDIGLVTAVLLGLALLALGLGVSPCRPHHGLIAALVLAYDFAGKRVLWLGALGMGTLRGLNLWTAAAFAAAAADDARHRLLTAAFCYGCYITAVTVLGIFEDLPKVRGRAVAAVQTAPPLAAMIALLTVQGGLWPAPALAALPMLWFLRRNATTVTWDQPAIRRSMMFLLLGTMLYTALLALAAGRPVEAAAIAAVIAPARWIARRIALT
jgi:4-hydroxybenzoate polyprenyltransferase